MEEIWIIAEEQNETYGQGNFGTSWKLPRTGPCDTGEPHPGFPTEEQAQAYIDGIKYYSGLLPVKIKVRA